MPEITGDISGVGFLYWEKSNEGAMLELLTSGAKRTMYMRLTIVDGKPSAKARLLTGRRALP